jgi:hypothetical protein
VPELYCKIKEIEAFLYNYDVKIWLNLKQ